MYINIFSTMRVASFVQTMDFRLYECIIILIIAIVRCRNKIYYYLIATNNCNKSHKYNE